MRELLRHFAIFTLVFVALLGLMVGAYLWMAKSDSMISEFSPAACEKEGGSWDAAIEICRRAND